MKGTKKKLVKEYPKFKKDFNQLRNILNIAVFEAGWARILLKCARFEPYLTKEWDEGRGQEG